MAAAAQRNAAAFSWELLQNVPEIFEDAALVFRKHAHVVTENVAAGDAEVAAQQVHGVRQVVVYRVARTDHQAQALGDLRVHIQTDAA